MIYPAIKDLTEKTDSRYSLVIATAKRARQISEESESDSLKPVCSAIDEIYTGETIIVSPKDKAKEEGNITEE